ncbi:MAG: PD-(D/E)XK nuclease domain-containing protein, partial [Anaerovorax sp.]
RTISYFDSGKEPSGKSEPERFYHGFVLGLMVDMEEQYTVRSNRESGFGRYDIMLEPKLGAMWETTLESKKEGAAKAALEWKFGIGASGDSAHDGIIMEFKVIDKTEEKDLEETAKSALLQIEEKQYEAELKAKGIKNIRKYGFAFEGKNVLIKQG